jgi:signal transduction histidine kinase
VKLRLRVGLTLLATALPLVAGLAWFRADLVRRTAEEQLRGFVLARMEEGGRERCEASPETFPEPMVMRPLRGPRPGAERFGPPPRELGDDPHFDRPPRDGDGGPPGARPALRDAPGAAGPPPGGPNRIEMFAYHPDFHSSNPDAPPFPELLRAALERGASLASTEWDRGPGGGIAVAMRMSWSTGPCAVMLARRPGPGPAAEGIANNFLFSALILCAALLGVATFAAGPIVGRVRRLTAQVRRAAAGGYAAPVEEQGKDEITELARAFNAAGAELRGRLLELEQRERTLRAFVENTTHDVMLPLTVLQGHLSSVRNRIDSREPVDRELVLDALEESHYLASLVTNLGIAAKLEAGEPRAERHAFRLDELVERAVGRHRPIAKPRGIMLDFAVPEEDTWVEGDVTLVEQAVSNVIHNAVRYNESGGHVLVLLERPSPKRFSLRVIDDGPGVSDEELVRLSERSFRGDEARTRHPGGHGLGLAIAQDVARRHGFELAIRRSEHRGLEVELSGPVLRESERERRSARREA